MIIDILIVDDIDANLYYLEILLKQLDIDDNEFESLNIIKASSGEEALKIAMHDKPELILLDIQMPGMDGFEVAQFLKSTQNTKDIPIVFLTASFKSTEFVNRGYSIGALDYLTKPIEKIQFLSKIKLYIKIIIGQKKQENLIKELNKHIKMLETISITDGLTDILNRRYFNEISPKILDSAKREDKFISFAMLDIDYFKRYNDTYGHHMGDDVLIRVAKVLKDSVHRADDYCFRLGGEEFGLLFNTNSKENAIVFVEKIRKNIENLHIEHKKNSCSDFLTASFGLIVEKANKIKDIDTLYRDTDNLLYKAKDSGRNRVVNNFKRGKICG